MFPTYGDAVDAERAQVYLEFLSDLSLEDLAFGLMEAGKHATSFPTPGIIRSYVTARKDSDLETRAHDALRRVDQLVETYGRDLLPFYGEPAPRLDPATQRALADIGGYKAYADRSEREDPFMRRGFLAAYKRRDDAVQSMEAEPKAMIAGLSDALLALPEKG